MTIWGDAKPAGATLGDDRNAVELGTRFTPSVPGQVTGIRYYKLPGVTGEHVGTLWTGAGERLATATFSDESRSGWQRASLERPVRLEPGRTYVVSYGVPEGGRYASAADPAAVSTTDALTVDPRDSGVYSYDGGGSFPDDSWRGTRYWVDVDYLVDAGASPPRPTASTPPPAPPPDGFPTRDSVGLPEGWEPEREVAGDLWIREAGTVVEDLRITDGILHVDAPDVTLRRIDAIDSRVVVDDGDVCKDGLVIEDSRFTSSGSEAFAVVGPGGYTIRDSLVDGVPEGLRAGGLSVGCGPVTVEHSFIHITPPKVCGDWHGDGIQGYDGPPLVVKKTTIVMEETGGCSGTAPFFYPSGQGNTSVEIDGLVVSGGGYSFRNGTPGSVRGLFVLDDWSFAPVDVDCSVLSAWQAYAAELDAAGQPVRGAAIRCEGSGN
ncbi:DUF4082 domain-containing protein [Agromyces sp. NPDC058136]|uniref:DUF4082 domain-containing protein n=1 Tax=Agromyces sp. NPDC058136 TaxID=3346354 RepID=UPI0036DA2DCF